MTSRNKTEHGVEGDSGEGRGMLDGSSYPLPDTWTESSIGEVTVKAKQRDPRKTPDEMFQYVDVSSVSNESFKITAATPTLGRESPSRARKELNTDDVLFATVRPTLQRIAFVPNELDGQIASTGYCVLRSEQAKVHPRFLYFFLITDYFNARMAGLERGANYPAIRDSDIKNAWLPLPPLPEQKKIAHILSTVQRAIEAQEQIIQTTTELFKSMLHQLMTAQIRVSNRDRIEGSSGKNLGMIEGVPDGWAEVEFENFTTLQRGQDLTRAQFRKGTVPVAGSNGIIGYHDTAFTKAPGITVGRSGSAGKVTVYNEDFWPHNTSLYVREFHGNDPHFAGYLLEWLNLSRFKTGASVPTLNRNSFKTLLIHVPPLPEQKKIAHILSTIQQKVDNSQSKKSKLQALFRTLLHELMTARIRVDKI